MGDPIYDSDAAEHRALCHYDGSECEDGCDRQAAWCKCIGMRNDARRRRAGWIVCGRCNKAICA